MKVRPARRRGNRGRKLRRECFLRPKVPAGGGTPSRTGALEMMRYLYKQSSKGQSPGKVTIPEGLHWGYEYLRDFWDGSAVKKPFGRNRTSGGKGVFEKALVHWRDGPEKKNFTFNQLSIAIPHRRLLVWDQGRRRGSGKKEISNYLGNKWGNGLVKRSISRSLGVGWRRSFERVGGPCETQEWEWK